MNRKNNFDFIRLIFASFVIITHAFPLSGKSECDWLCQLTNGQIVFSYIGVKGFFVISGYLIFQSLERSSSLLDYFWKRFLRLFPALFFVLVLTVLLAPFVYNNTLPYLSNRDVLSYIPNNILLFKVQYYIAGIFEHNPYKGAINGSLWTIRYEFTMYVILSLLFFFRKNTLVIKMMLVIAFSLLSVGFLFFKTYLAQFGFILEGRLLLDLGSFFIAGSLLSSFKIEQYKYFNLLAIFSLLIIIISLYFSFFNWVTLFTFPLLVIYLGVESTPILRDVGSKIGDLSYGIYIYAFPVQQTLYYYFHSNYIQLMIYGFIISSILAYFSWHLIESKALTYKRLLKKNSVR